MLTRGLALAHARPEGGAIAVGLCAARLLAPVDFAGAPNGPVDIVLALASPDKDSHLRMMKSLSRSLMSGLPDKLRSASDETDMRSLLQEATADDE